MGGIHERKEFHLTSIDGQFPSIETLWNTEFNRMRPLGRELAILKQAGYRCIKLDANRGITFSSCTLDNAPPLISELQTRLAAIRSLKDFQILLAGSFKSNK